MTDLRLSKDLKLPLDAVTQTLGIVASRGSGKTYLTAVLGEEMIRAGLPVCVLDPIGVYWGWRSSADGKRDGLPVVILGGEHADAPLEATAGKVIADWVVEERRPCVLDLSLFRKGEQRQFVTDFAETLYRKNRDPLHLILDEADLFAPQRPMPGEQRMLGAIEDLVRRGRARGLGLSLVTQRPAVLHKDVLTQVSVLVALRMLGPQDRDAVDAWIKFHGDAAQRRTVLESLPALPIGTAWVWSPGWLGVLKKVQVRKRETFDSSSTPKVGTKKIEPQKLAPVDLKALSSRIASTIERAKAEDPKALRLELAARDRRIAELERQVAAKPAASVERVEVTVPVMDAHSLAAIESLAEHTKAQAVTMAALLEEARKLTAAARPARSAASLAAPPERHGRRAPPKPAPRSNGARRPADTNLGTGERATLIAAAERPRDGVGRDQLSVLTGYKRSSRDSYIQRLRAAGYLELRGDQLFATEAGIAALGDTWEQLPTGHELQRHWFERLPEGERKVLEVLVGAYPKAVERERIDEATGYKRSSRDTYLQRLGARRLVEQVGRGEVRASAELFD